MFGLAERAASSAGCSVSGRAAISITSSTLPTACHQRRRGLICCSRSGSDVIAGPVHNFALWRPEDGLDEAEIDLDLQLGDISPLPTPILSSQKAFDRLFGSVHVAATTDLGAFYSSELGGVVTNPAFMVLHMDDHMVHRGHAVAESVHLSDGYLFQLPQRIQRFKQSAEAASIGLPVSDAQLMRIILDTAAASKKSNGTVKFWLSAGRGGFGLSSRECLKPALFVLTTSEICPQSMDRTRGWTARSCPLPPKALLLKSGSAQAGKAQARADGVLSNNLLEAAMAKAYAEENATNVALFVDEEGYILQGPSENVAMIGQDESVLVTPPFDTVPAGLTMQRLIKLLPEAHRKFPDDVVVKKVEQRRIHCDELLDAKEVFLVGSAHLITPIVCWNDKVVADGTPGVICLALANVLELDMKPREGSPDLMQVPYGYLTGMRSQLV